MLQQKQKELENSQRAGTKGHEEEKQYIQRPGKRYRKNEYFSDEEDFSE